MEYLADIFRNVSEQSSLLDVNNTKITRQVHLYDQQMAANKETHAFVLSVMQIVAELLLYKCCLGNC